MNASKDVLVSFRSAIERAFGSNLHLLHFVSCFFLLPFFDHNVIRFERRKCSRSERTDCRSCELEVYSFFTTTNAVDAFLFFFFVVSITLKIEPYVITHRPRVHFVHVAPSCLAYVARVLSMRANFVRYISRCVSFHSRIKDSNDAKNFHVCFLSAIVK